MVYNQRKPGRQVAGNREYSVNCLTGDEEKPSNPLESRETQSGSNGTATRRGNGSGVAAQPQQTPGERKGMGMVTADDVALLERVVKRIKRWEIPDVARDELPAAMVEIACNPANNIRDRIAAARVLAQFDALNLSEEKHQSPQVRVNVHLTDDARQAKLAALLGNQRLLPQPNQSDTPATPAE